VILFDAGEGDASGDMPFLTTDYWGGELASSTGGIIILWEHRYYGQSFPDSFLQGGNVPSSQYQWLTTDNALADVDKFAWQFSRSEFPSVDLTPKTTPWVFVGGSYPGIRAALMRYKYPNTIFASYSASAPLQAQYDMSVYWEPVWEGMQGMGYANCSTDMHAAIQAIDPMLDDPTQVGNFISNFTAGLAVGYTPADFAYLLANPLYGWQNGGVGPDLNAFCNYLEQDDQTGEIAGAEGFAASRGAQYVVDRWSKYISSTSSSQRMNEAVAKVKANLLGIRALRDGQTQSMEDKSWPWQVCTEWGFFQDALLGDHQLISKQVSIDVVTAVCKQQFPDYTGSLTPDVAAMNEKYKGWDLRVTNTFTTYGEYDPWMMLGAASPIAQGGNNQFTETIPECQTANEVDSSTPLFGMLLPNSEHCADFVASQHSDIAARPHQLFTQALQQWLSCGM
jgi:hypothetical protein